MIALMGPKFSDGKTVRDFKTAFLHAVKLGETLGPVDPHMGAVQCALQAQVFEHRLQMQGPAEAQHQNAKAAADRL